MFVTRIRSDFYPIKDQKHAQANMGSNILPAHFFCLDEPPLSTKHVKFLCIFVDVFLHPKLVEVELLMEEVRLTTSLLEIIGSTTFLGTEFLPSTVCVCV